MNYQDILWISHSAISAFKKCPRLYYMQYVYRNPETGNRIQIINPYLSLGSAVHDTVEELADFPAKERIKMSLEERFKKIFSSYSGVQGGFISEKKEEEFKERGLMMVRRVEGSPMLKSPSLKPEKKLPNVDLFKGVKLVGSLDWIEVLHCGGAHIIDFKTGNSKETNGSLQLPIYTILAKENIDKEVKKVSYWYLQHDDTPVEHEIGDVPASLQKIKDITLEIQKAIESKHFPCSYPGRCFACGDYDRIFSGEAKMIGSQGKKDNFCVFKPENVMEKIVEDDFLDEREKKIFEMRTKKKMEEIEKELNLSAEKSEKIVGEIKEKLKKNLSPVELRVVIKMLQ